MSISTVQRRYAQAVFKIAVETSSLEVWSRDLETMTSILQDSALRNFLDAPEIPTSSKYTVLKNVLATRVSSIALNLVFLLNSKRQITLIQGITDTYQQLLDTHQGIERGTLITAVPLDNKQKSKASHILETMVGRQLRLTTQIQPDILGGVIAKVGDRVIDGSLKTRLAQMQRMLID